MHSRVFFEFVSTDLLVGMLRTKAENAFVAAQKSVVRSRHVLITTFCCLAATTLSAARAQESDKPEVIPADVWEITLSPQAVERPLLKYRLLPAEFELTDGNAAPILLRLPWDQMPYFSTVVPTFTDYLNIPLDDPKVLNSGDVFQERFYQELRRAAYRRTAEWEHPIGESPLATILLPDVQGARAIVSRGLSVWIRYHIAHGNFDEAREGILVGLANSRHYGRTPFVIIQYVSVSFNNVMLARLEELISQPESPNMYWALTALPRPLIDLRPSFELEQRFLEETVAGLDKLDELKTEAQWYQRAQEVIDVMQDSGNVRQPAGTIVLPIVSRLAKHARAERPEWIEGGADRIAKMSDPEVGLRWLLYKYKDQSQEISALMSLEPQLAIPRLKALQKRLAVFRAQWGFPTVFVLDKPFNTYLSVRRVQRRIDALRTIEAIRNYAATHKSQLPKSLDQIVDTPIPNDLFTGKPFLYEVNEESATLSAQGFPIDGRERGAIFYRITLRK